MTLIVTITASAEDDTWAWHNAMRKLHEEWVALTREKRSINAEVKTLEEQLKVQEELLALLQNQVATFEKNSDGPKTDSETEAIPQKMAQDDTERKKELIDSAREKLVVLEGKDDPLGTGFLIKQGQETRIYTSPYNIDGNEEIKITRPSGPNIPINDQIGCPEGITLVSLQPTNEYLPCFEIASKTELPNVGDKILVINVDTSSSSVYGVIGSIRGIGPDILELSADLLPEMSGAPVLSMETGRVIGIVSSQIEGVNADWATGTRHEEKRNFALRIDHVQNWQTITLNRFVKQSQYIEDINERTNISWLAHMLIDVQLRQTLAKQHHGAPEPLEFANEEEYQKAHEKWRIEWLAEKERLSKLQPEIEEEAKPYASNMQIKRAKQWASDCRERSGHATHLTLWERRSSIYRFMHNELKREDPDWSAHLTWFHKEQHRSAVKSRKDGLQVLIGIIDRAER